MHHQQYAEKSDEKQLPTIWSLPDPLWSRIKKLLPPEKEPGTPGRPAVPFRTVLDGILYVLRTGCHWKAVPKKYGSGSTVHRRFQEWQQAGIMEKMVEVMLSWYDQRHGIDWEWQSADTKLLPAPLGGDKTGPNPTDLGKSGSKRHLLIDGQGAPLAFHLTAAHRHDKIGLPTLLKSGWFIARPQPTEQARQHLCLDKGYDYVDIEELVADLDYQAHIKRRGETDEPGIGEPIHPARRWKVERTISWFNNMRKLRTRWEKKAANYQALWLFAAVLIIYRLIVLG